MAHKVVEGYYLNRAVVYIDDTVIYGKDEASFLQMLDMVLDRMTKFNVRLKPSKCSFGMTSVEFLGHIFDDYGVHLSTKGCKELKIFLSPRRSQQSEVLLEWSIIFEISTHHYHLIYNH